MEDTPGIPDKRRMIRVSLSGAHTHGPIAGVNVHCYRRGKSFLARGRLLGKPFGHSLGETEADATMNLRRLLTAIDNGTFIPASQLGRRPSLAVAPVPLLTLEELALRFLSEKLRLKGKDTMQTYRGRLARVLAFASLPANRKRWPLARDVDRSFAIECRVYLFSEQCTRNGKPGATFRSVSGSHIRNMMETVRGMLHWASKPEIRLLPAAFANPFTRDVVGEREEKDPLRAEVMPLETRVRMASEMDCWQLATLGLAMALPLRPEELTGLLVGDVDFVKHEIRVGTRLGGGDYTKGRQSFVLPLPEELDPLVLACIDGRAEGPLLCRRTIWAGEARPRGHVYNADELGRRYEEALAKARPQSVQTEQDRKAVFRGVLRELGGADPDELAKEFKKITARLGFKNRFYDLRHAVTTDMHRAGVRHLELRYLTAHTTKDILNEYVALDAHGEMAKYAEYVKPLFEALRSRGKELGCLQEWPAP